MRSNLRITLSTSKGNFVQSRLRIEDALCTFAINHRFISHYNLSCLSKDSSFFVVEIRFAEDTDFVESSVYVLSFLNSLRARFCDVYHTICSYTYHTK